MNHDVIKGDWKQLKGKVKQWWGNLTDDDLQKIDGNFDKLVGAVQSRYGYERQRALDEVSRRMDEFQKKHAGRGSSS